MSEQPRLERVRTATLEIACEISGPNDGVPVILLHGFPDDPRTWDGAVSQLSGAGYRTIVPYLRGYGPTRFLRDDTPRSGQQAALAQDLLDLMDGLQLKSAALVGYDWGGRAACIVAALWPHRARCLVSVGGYNMLNVAASAKPAPPVQEHKLWYQWYFSTERGRAGLKANRREFCRLLWQLWSPNWRFDDATYERTAASFDNPDFVDVVIHSYRHRFGWAPGDPSLETMEERLAAMPKISVPTIVLHGRSDGVASVESSERHARFFSGPYLRRVIPEAGHFLAWEAPDAIVQAVRELVPAPASTD
jgi:pimeloyl-ACP methyl ester carboxylesterase